MHVCMLRMRAVRENELHTQEQVKRRGCRSGHSGNSELKVFPGNVITLTAVQRVTASYGTNCLHDTLFLQLCKDKILMLTEAMIPL